MDELTTMAERYTRVAGRLDERGRRAVAGAEALALGVGGISRVARGTGLARATVSRGMRELEGDLPTAAPGRVRLPGGGRKPVTTQDPTLLPDLDRLIDPATRGDPESPLRWTCKSLRRLAAELQEMGHRVSHETVGCLLRGMRDSLQANRKTREGSSHPDRDDQFAYINETATERLAAGEPVISVDTKKKELVGDFKNAGLEWRPKDTPEEVRVHDFVLQELGKVNPYGVYDLGRNEGWVNVGIDHDTATFAVASLRRWWDKSGQYHYAHAKRLLITADGGGSNGSRLRLWKYELQQLAEETGLQITVCHYPPGTSKWNKIEHRLFSFITQNWRGQPLVSHAVILSLIAATTTATGLRVESYLDTTKYPTGIRPTDEQMATIRLARHDFHGEWNYTIIPHQFHEDTVIV
jgi:hypothetical protein